MVLKNEFRINAHLEAAARMVFQQNGFGTKYSHVFMGNFKNGFEY